MREIEIKVRVKDLAGLEKKLALRGCVLSAPISQHDVIYSVGGSGQEFQSMKEGDIVIRIRHLKDTAELNLKKQQSNEMDNIEYETEVKDPKIMDGILREMGYIPEVEVKKARRKGKLGEYEICLDEVEKLGSFMEIEKLTADDIDVNVVRKELITILESLELSSDNEETRGYDTQIYQLSHK